jgi:hypothetical protein
MENFIPDLKRKDSRSNLEGFDCVHDEGLTNTESLASIQGTLRWISTRGELASAAAELVPVQIDYFATIASLPLTPYFGFLGSKNGFRSCPLAKYIPQYRKKSRKGEMGAHTSKFESVRDYYRSPSGRSRQEGREPR